MFTIDTENNITAHTGLLAGAEESQSFSRAKELAQLSAEWHGSRLVEIWNSFAGVAPFDDLKAVKKFTDRKAAVTRILGAMPRESFQTPSVRSRAAFLLLLPGYVTSPTGRVIKTGTRARL